MKKHRAALRHSLARAIGLPLGAIAAAALLLRADVAYASGDAAWPQAAYSFDAPNDLYLSDDSRGCEGHSNRVRPTGTHVLAITLFPDAYCSLMHEAICTYRFDAGLASRLGSGGGTAAKSAFQATWSEACIVPHQIWPKVVSGRITLSGASDLGLDGTFDLALADGTQLRGTFTGNACAAPPPNTKLMCHKT